MDSSDEIVGIPESIPESGINKDLKVFIFGKPDIFKNARILLFGSKIQKYDEYKIECISFKIFNR